MKKKYYFSITDKPKKCVSHKNTFCNILAEYMILMRNEPFFKYKEVQLALLSNLRCQEQCDRMLWKLNFETNSKDLFSEENITKFKNGLYKLPFPRFYRGYLKKNKISNAIDTILETLDPYRIHTDYVSYNHYLGNLNGVDTARAIVAYIKTDFKKYLTEGEIKEVKPLKVVNGFNIELEESL